MASKKLDKKALVLLAKEFNKVMKFDKPVPVTGTAEDIAKAIKGEVDALFTADKEVLSAAAWDYCTKVLKLTPEDADAAPVAEEPAKETAGEKKARLKAEKQAAKDEKATAAKGADKPTAKKAPAAKKGPGVIATIRSILFKATSKAKAVSKDEIVAELAKVFPDKKAESMANTVQVQLSRTSKETDRDVKKTDDGKFFTTKSK